MPHNLIQRIGELSVAIDVVRKTKELAGFFSSLSLARFLKQNISYKFFRQLKKQFVSSFVVLSF